MTRQPMASKRPEPPAPERAAEWPGGVPVATRNYLAHVEGGQTIRALAKEAEVHPSTILRRVRRVEALRDDPLLDAALRRMAGQGSAAAEKPSLATLLREATPVLRHLSEPGAVLAIARDMEKGVVAREGPGGEPQRLAVVERAFAEEMALRGWIACLSPESRVQRYRIASGGRALLRGGAVALRRPGFSEAAASFAMLSDEAPDSEDDRLHHMRSALAETPLMSLSRRRDESGTPFLSRDHLVAGERLREDFELAQRDEEDAPPDWEAFLDALPLSLGVAETPRPRGVERAGEKVRRAVLDLGPGMADVALRCCCLLEGLETVERRLGWSARSGKIVLRIALWRLHQHYRAEDARLNPLIG